MVKCAVLAVVISSKGMNRLFQKIRGVQRELTEYYIVLNVLRGWA